MAENEYYDDVELDEDEITIDWFEFLSRLLKNWKFIAVITIASVVMGVVIAIVSPRKYTVTVTLAPEVQGKSSGSLGSIANMLGMGSVSIGSSSDALNITLFPEICSSTQFLIQLFNVEVTPYVSSEKFDEGIESPKPTTYYRYLTKADKEPGLIASLKQSFFGPSAEEPDTINPAHLSKKQYGVVRYLRKQITASVDKKTGVTAIKVVSDDPWIATTMADTVCSRLQNYVIEYRTKKAASDLDYYEKLADNAKQKMIQAQSAYAASVDFDRSVILQSVRSERDRLQQEAQLASQIYGQMQQQVEMAKAKFQEVKPVYAVIQPATMPDKASSMSRRLVVMLSMMLGFCGASAWVLFGKDFWGQMKTRMEHHTEDEIVEQNVQ